MIVGNPFSRRDLATLPVNFWLVGQQVSQVQRHGRYTQASTRSHPGKMLPELARQILTAYTHPGDWVLDPMSGIGTTGVEAIHLGRHYVGIELEARFTDLQQENLELARSQGATGRFAVIRHDARRLASEPPARMLPESADAVDAVITSPPYGDRLRSVRTPTRVLRDLISAGRFGAGVIPGVYGQEPANLGNLSDLDYLREIRTVYQGCFEVLRPGGYLIIVIRPGRDRERLRPLHHETARICVELGFTFVDEIVAILSRVAPAADGSVRIAAHALFFKRLAVAHLREAGHPVTLEQLEYVLVFQKPLADRIRSRPRKSGLSAALVGSRTR